MFSTLSWLFIPKTERTPVLQQVVKPLIGLRDCVKQPGGNRTMDSRRGLVKFEVVLRCRRGKMIWFYNSVYLQMQHRILSLPRDSLWNWQTQIALSVNLQSFVVYEEPYLSHSFNSLNTLYNLCRYFFHLAQAKIALQGKCVARTGPSGQWDGGFSNTTQDFTKHREEIFRTMMLSFQVLLQRHTQLVRQTNTGKHNRNTPKPTFTLNRLLNKRSTVMNIVLHLNMKNPLWRDILYGVWSTTIFLFSFLLPWKGGEVCSLYISLMCLWLSVFFPFMPCSNK